MILQVDELHSHYGKSHILQGVNLKVNEGEIVALLGRNHPVGIAFAALLFAFLDAQANGLQITAGVSDRLVLVIQGVIVLSVVIAYEVVRRAGIRLEQRTVAAQLAEQAHSPLEGARS